MRKGAAFWNEHDTKVFCEICKEETDAGNRVDGYLSAEGYRNLQLKFNARTQRGYVKEHFKYRWNSLKYEYTRFRNGPPPDNLSLLDGIFGEARDGKSLAIPVGEHKQEATRVNVDGSDEDAELTPSAMKKAKSAKRKASSPVLDDVSTKEEKSPLLLEYKKEATLVNIDGSDEDAELTPSAMKKAKLAIPGYDLGGDKEMATPVNIVGPEKHAELTPSAMNKAKLAKRKVSSPMVAASITEGDKSPFPQKCRKACDALTTSVEASSCDSNTVPTIREVVGLIRDCGVSEGTALFYTATKVVALNPEYRELFALIQTKEGRFDWLQRAHDDTAMRVHPCSSK